MVMLAYRPRIFTNTRICADHSSIRGFIRGWSGCDAHSVADLAL